MEGERVGEVDGFDVGRGVGLFVGFFDGDSVGMLEGLMVGVSVGTVVGFKVDNVGLAEGELDGWPNCRNHSKYVQVIYK